MSGYDPAEFWASKLRKQGPAYVASLKDAGKQQRVFESALCEAAGYLDLHPSERTVLDYGCGVGRFARTLAPVPPTEGGYLPGVYVGLDLLPEALEMARTEHGAGERGSRQMLFDLASSLAGRVDPCSDDGFRFDAAFSVTCLQHVEPEEVRRVCALLGRAAEAVVLVEDANPEGAPRARHMWYRSPVEYAQWLGLQVVRTWTIDAERPGSHWVGIFR